MINNTVNGYTTDLTETFDRVKSSVVSVLVNHKRRSGVIYATTDKTTYIFTSAEKISDEDILTVQFDSGAKVNGKLLGIDDACGVALLAVETDFRTKAFTLGDSSIVNLGEYVLGMGSRKESGQAMVDFGVTSTVGMYYLSEDAHYAPDLFETSMDVNAANLGGSLMNLSGELIGVLVEMPLGGMEQHGYALSVNELKKIYKQLRSDGVVTRGSLGVLTKSISRMESYEKNELNISLNQKTGVVVTEGSEDGVLLENDLLLTMDHQTITNHEALKTMCYSYQSGDTVIIELKRDGENQTVSVVLQ